MPGIDEKKTEIRYRLKDPSKYKEFRRKKLGKKSGVSIILGKLKNQDEWETQAYRFQKPKYTPARAQCWLRQHNIPVRGHYRKTTHGLAWVTHHERNVKGHYLGDIGKPTRKINIGDIEITEREPWQPETYQLAKRGTPFTPWKEIQEQKKKKEMEKYL